MIPTLTVGPHLLHFQLLEIKRPSIYEERSSYNFASVPRLPNFIAPPMSKQNELSFRGIMYRTNIL